MLARPDLSSAAASLSKEAISSEPPPRERWGDLRLRVASAAVLAPAGVACIWFGGWLFAAMIALFGAGLGAEYGRISSVRARVRPGLAGAAVSVALALSAFVTQLGQPGLALLALLVFAAALAVRRAALAAGLVYVGAAAVAMPWLRQDPAGQVNVLFVFLVIWANDVGAYAFGRLVGGPQLAPRVSPGKTWAGALGGLVLGMAVGHWTALAFAAEPGPATLVAGAVVGVAAQVGDLLESWIKRLFGVKDSGRLIPGHGGLLDRLDGVLIAGPVAAALALLAGPGEVLWHF